MILSSILVIGWNGILFSVLLALKVKLETVGLRRKSLPMIAIIINNHKR